MAGAFSQLKVKSFEWIEPKLLTIYVVDQQGKRVNPTEIPVTNDGTYGYIYSITIRHILIQQEKSVLVLAGRQNTLKSLLSKECSNL